MNFDIQIAHSVTEIGQAAWDRLSSERPFASYRWYQFGEATLPDCLPLYIVLSLNNEPIARATFWLKRQEWLPITSPVARYGVDKLFQKWPLLSCETPLACFSGLILPESNLRTAALETITRTALELGKKHHASFALFGYIKHPETQQPGWPKTLSPITYADAETSLEIIWPDFDSYLKHLAKSTRRNFRLHGEQAADLGITTTIHPGVSDMDRALTLIENVETHHQVGHRPWTRSLLENSTMVDSAWITATIENRLVGCCALIGDDGFQIATMLGLDYSFPQFIYIYYQIIYAAIRCALERGTKVLYGGGGAYELKRRLGFQKMPDDYIMVAATGKVFQWLVQGAARWMGIQRTNVTIPPNPDNLH